jgi:hypothetical protein
VNNVVFIDFYNKDNFPPGKWLHEPDFCGWQSHGLACLAIRDMSLGVWNGFVGLEATHPYFAKHIDDILHEPTVMDAFLSVHGGIASAGGLPSRYKSISQGLWWLGIETSHGGDLMPLLKNDPDMDKMLSGQTYKDFVFIRRETNKLASYMSRIK